MFEKNSLLIEIAFYVLCVHLEEEDRADCFAFIVFGISSYCKCYVALPHGAVGRSAVCDCVFS